MKDTFHVGDVVELLPYDDVENRYGIMRHNWEDVRAQNPLTIRTITRGKIFVDGSFYWFRKDAFVRYYEPIFAPVEDLL